MTPLPVKELERLSRNMVSTMSARPDRDLERMADALERLILHLMWEREYRHHRNHHT